MKQKRRSMEEIIRIIRQADGGKTVREVCREHNVHEVTFHRWKRKYGGLKLDDAQKLKGVDHFFGILRPARGPKHRTTESLDSRNGFRSESQRLVSIPEDQSFVTVADSQNFSHVVSMPELHDQAANNVVHARAQATTSDNTDCRFC